MSRIHIFSVFVASGAILTACSTSENAIVDDVYSLKPVEFPIGTDLTDETDYNSYVYNKEQTDREQTYYEDFRRQRNNSMNPSGPTFGFRPGVMIGYGMMNPYGSYGYSPYGYYDPWNSSHYGYGYGYNSPYYGYNPYYNPYYGYNPYNPYEYGNYGYGNYGYGNPYYNGYGSGSYVVVQTPGNYHSGPRGSIAGMGGVTSRSTSTLKSAGTTATAPGSGGRTAVASGKVSSPAVNPGRSVSDRNVTSKPVSSSREVGRPVTTSRPETYTSSPARPASTVKSSVGSPSQRPFGTSVSSPSRNTDLSSPKVSTPSRTTTQPASTPSRSSGSSGSGSTSRPSVKPGRP